MAQQTQDIAAFWAMGDYASVAATIGGLGEDLVLAAGVGPGDLVLDVGAGTGNATLPAAAAGGRVVGADITPQLLRRGDGRRSSAG